MIKAVLLFPLVQALPETVHPAGETAIRTRQQGPDSN